MTINYSHFVEACGRNGMMHQYGLHINRIDNVVTLFPINTRGIDHGWLQIPVSDLNEVIAALDKARTLEVRPMRRKNTSNATIDGMHYGVRH